MKLSQTPVDTIELFSRQFFIKRDDLLHPEFSGNKARKFAYFLENDFPGVKKLIGYGSPQANSLYSMSALAKLKGWQLDFYVDHIASYIKINPKGNYGAALANGANVIALDSVIDRDDADVYQYIQETIIPNEQHAVFVPEGGRCSYAEYGVFKLAEEVAQWSAENQHQKIVVFLPSGTGTTALFLNKYFVMQNLKIQVLTCAVVGGDEYLTKQFYELEPNAAFHPKIISLSKKYHFGKLYREFYEMWQEATSLTGIEFELLYDPLGLLALKQYFEASDNDKVVLYLHQGGVLGNETMRPRYERKYGAI